MQWKLLKNSLPKYSIEVMETWVDSVLQGNVLDRNLMAFVAEGGVYNVSLKRRDQGTPVLSNPIQMLKIRSIQASPKRSKKKTRVVRRFVVQTQPMIVVRTGLFNDKKSDEVRSSPNGSKQKTSLNHMKALKIPLPTI